VFAECLAVGLACENQRRLTGSGCALKAGLENITIFSKMSKYRKYQKYHDILDIF